MVRKEVAITNPRGIHARPSGLLNAAALQFKSSIELQIGDRTADARNIMEIMALGGHAGETVRITTEGRDEEEALQAVIDIFARNFDDS